MDLCRAYDKINYTDTHYIFGFNTTSLIQLTSFMVGRVDKSLSRPSKLSLISVQRECQAVSDIGVDSQISGSNHESLRTSRSPEFDNAPKQPLNDHPAKRNKRRLLQFVSRGLGRALRNDIGPPVPPKDYHHPSVYQSVVGTQMTSEPHHDNMDEPSFLSPSDMKNKSFSRLETEDLNQRSDHFLSDTLASTIDSPASNPFAKHSLGSKSSFRNLVAQNLKHSHSPMPSSRVAYGPLNPAKYSPPPNNEPSTADTDNAPEA